MYNTGNPLGSSNPKDLDDNAVSIDHAVNGPDPSFTTRFGVQRYSIVRLHTLIATAVSEVDPTVVAAKAAVNSVRDESIAEMQETAATLGADLNNKRYSTYAAMVADPQTRNAVVTIVDGDPTESLNGWYSWDAATSSYSYFFNQPSTTATVNAAALSALSAGTTTDLTFSSTWASGTGGGGTVLNRYGRASGISVPAGQTGALTYVSAMFPTATVVPASLVGATVQAVITGRLTGNAGGTVKLRNDRAFRVSRSGVLTPQGRLISENIIGSTFKRVVEYVVTAADTQLGVILTVADGPAATAASSFIIDRVSFGVVAAAQTLTPYSNADLERSKLFSDVTSNAGVSWRWEPSTIASGYATLSNGATTLPAGAVAPLVAGMKIPAGSSGANSYFFSLFRVDPAMVASLAGSTIRITARFSSTVGAEELIDLSHTANMRAVRDPSTASASVPATLVSMSQQGGIITKVLDYVVDPADSKWAVALLVHGSAVAVSQDIDLRFISMEWALKESGSVARRASDVATAARFRELAWSEGVDGLAVTSGNMLPEATVTGEATAGNGGSLVYENGAIVGFDIAPGLSGATTYLRIMLPFDAETRALLVGKTVRFIVDADVSETMQYDKVFRRDRAVYVNDTATNVGTLVSEKFDGTRYTRIVDWVVEAGATLFGPAITSSDTLVTQNNNTFRLRGVRWQIRDARGETNSDFMLDRRIADIAGEVVASSGNATGTPKVIGKLLETQSFTGFNPTIQAYTLDKIGGQVDVAQQVLTIDAPATESVANFAFTLIASPSGGSVPGIALPHQYTSGRVVKRVSDNVTLEEGVDYAVKPNTCYIYGLKAIANVACTISYTGYLHRYDLVSLNMGTGALAVTKGTGRAIDPEEYKPALPAGNVLLNEVYVYPDGVDVLQSWRFRNFRDQLSGQDYDDWLAYCRSCLPKTLAKLRRGQPIRLIGYGSSSIDMGTGRNSQLAPNGPRDLPSFFDRIPADTRLKYPTYTGSDPDFAGSTETHVKYGFMWQLIGAMRERWGADVEYRNWGVAATTSAATLNGSLMNGAYPDRLNAMCADGGDIMVLAFANGIGASWWYDTHRTIIEAFKATGGEVIVLTTPRTNFYGGYSPNDTNWKKSHDDSVRVALDTGSAYVPTNLIEGPGREGGTGLSTRNMSNANLFNHGGPVQLGNTGLLMAMIIP